MSDITRRQELAKRLEQVRQEITESAQQHGHAVPELIVVTKNFPASDIVELNALGAHDVGENKVQEALAKIAELNAGERALSRSPQLRWHFIGQLQRNKAKHVAKFAYSVHSIDRPELADALSRGHDPGKDIESFIQVDLQSGTQEHRGGVEPARLLELASHINSLPGLRLAGVMSVAPLGADPDEAFGYLNQLAHQLQQDFPEATGISAGMSHDFDAAIKNGATHLRIGSKILGNAYCCALVSHLGIPPRRAASHSYLGENYGWRYSQNDGLPWFGRW